MHHGGDQVSGARLCDVVAAHEDRLIEVWSALGPDGPTLGSPNAGSTTDARERFLRPLVRTLVGALAGSAEHAAIYADERTRYVEAAEPAERRRLLSEALERETPIVLEAIAPPGARADLELALRTLHAPLVQQDASHARVMFIGDCLFVETRAFLVPLARTAGRPVDVRNVFFSANQAVESVNDAVVEEVRAFKPELIGVSLFSFEGVPPYAAAWRRAATPVPIRSFSPTVRGLTELLRRLLLDLRTVTDAPVVLHAPGGLPLDPVRRRVRRLAPHSANQRRLLDELGESVGELAAAMPNVIMLDERQLTGSRSRLRELNGPVFDPGDVPVGYAHTTRFGPVVAGRYEEINRAYGVFGRAKVLLVDFDNTLWKGVMAEGPVVHDHRAQRLLLELKNAGVLLVALSKNDASAIRWQEMVLKPEDFVSLKINWMPKPDNTRAAIAELNLGANAFVLLDDNPVERALVTEQVPGVQAVDSLAPATWTALRHWLSFPSTTQTEEARRRTEMYREAADRRAAMGEALDYPTMMKSLKLRCVIRLAVPADRERLVELVQRTNQFNTTTLRRSGEEIDALLTDPGHRVYVLELRDRFGDLGVVALAIFERATRTFDSVIMSCRAMGFGVETALLSVVMECEGPGAVRGVFVPTERNAPAAGLFASSGFTETGTGVFELDADGVRPTAPDWLSLKVPVG